MIHKVYRYKNKTISYKIDPKWKMISENIKILYKINCRRLINGRKNILFWNHNYSKKKDNINYIKYNKPNLLNWMKNCKDCYY